MSLRIELSELSLQALDGLEADALAVFVGPERPLQGLAGFADWRLCGAVSRAIRAGVFHGARGEALLLPSGGRMAVPRVFCFGLGEEAVDLAGVAALSALVCETLARAGSPAFATALPPHPAGEEAAVARRWLESAMRFPGRKIVLLGDARPLQRDLGAARQALSAEVDVVLPASKVEMPSRGAAGLPSRSAVVR